MSSFSTEALISLVKSMTKAEKRNFKLFSSRVSESMKDAKFIQLYDFMDKVSVYSDKEMLEKNPTIKKEQIANLKQHLFKQILTSLRLQYSNDFPAAEAREALDYAYVLYQKGLYSASLKLLEKARKKAEKIHANILLLEIIEFEKKIASQYVSSQQNERANWLMELSLKAQKSVNQSVEFSNLALQLDGLFMRIGLAKSKEDYAYVEAFFAKTLPQYEMEELSFSEKMMLFNSFVWYYNILQDFLMCYRYAQKWVDLFDEIPKMKEIDVEMYLKGLHNLMLSLFHTRYYAKFSEVLEILENVDTSKYNSQNVLLLKELYICTSLINKHYLEGTFDEGVEIIPRVLDFIENASSRIDDHRIMVLEYKIACLYFGAGKNKDAIRYLNKVIQYKDQSYREDIQCFARILNLIAHFELGNDELLEYQIKSVYRFLIKMNELQGVQTEILNFLRSLPIPNENDMGKAFEQLLKKLTFLSHDKYEKRPFLYLDILSWLEAKIRHRTVQEVVQEKFIEEQTTGKLLYFPVKKS